MSGLEDGAGEGDEDGGDGAEARDLEDARERAEGCWPSSPEGGTSPCSAATAPASDDLRVTLRNGEPGSKRL